LISEHDNYLTFPLF